MTEATTTEAPQQGPTEDAPEVGVIRIAVGDQAVELSTVEHWVEDGLHVFRSTEFDCIAEGKDLASAVVTFIESAEDLFRLLDDLLDAGRATDDETRTLVKLSRRFFEVSEAMEQEEARRALISLRRRLRRPQWQPQTTRDSSSELLHA
jgi:hypothetical protein